MINCYEDLIKYVKGTKTRRRIAVDAAHDRHTLEGIAEGCRQGVTEPVLIGDEARIRSIISEEKLTIPVNDIEIINELDDTEAAAEAVRMVRERRADIIMKGILPTAHLLKEVVNRETGIKRGSVLSHVGLFQIPSYHKLIILTDGGMLLAPDAQQKRQIVENAVRVMESLGRSMPKVAALCATEEVNPRMTASVDAAQLKKWNQEGILKDCIVEGPISFDLMFDKEAASVKHFESPVAGDADIWLMPDMTAGNLVAKSLMCAAGAKMAGLIVGADAPVVVVSRGASAEEKYYSLIFAAAIAAQEEKNGI